MSSKPILITGATGSIGRNVVEFLLERGHKARAFVYKGENNEQSSQLQQLGAEIAVGDLLDFDEEFRYSTDRHEAFLKKV